MSQSLPSSTTVLVVGAGPAGMACALSLWSSGVRDMVIVDAVEHGYGGDNSSRAFSIHASTLEALDLVGCAGALVERGIKVTTMNYYDRSSNILVGADFTKLIEKTNFPFVIILPQRTTEGVLHQKLADVGVSIFRPYKAVGMRTNSKDSQLVDVSFENGQSITAQYVIGADGSKSVIRELSGIKFTDPGSTVEQDTNNFAQMVVADIVFDKTPPLADDFYAVVSQTSFFAITPIEHPTPGSRDAQDKTIYRLACGVPPSEGEAPSKAGVEYCQHLLDTYGPYTLNSDNDKSKNPDGAAKVTGIVWSTRFRTRYSAAEIFFTYFGNDGKEAGAGGSSRGAKVCLIGDAAHIHPPAGGQGMNLGLRDGISLGPVIASAITAGSSPESDEKVRAHMAGRHERALKVIGITKIMSHTVGMSPVLQSKFWWSPIPIHTVRDWVLWMLSKSSYVRETLAYKFAGLEDRMT
ncbi:hypothetical protein V8E52_004668 [Russula decolorans]